MARITIGNHEEGTQAPFLRGILTRSLQNSGLGFEESYAIADLIRNELNLRAEESDGEPVHEVSSDELRGLVGEHLKHRELPEILRRYERRAQTPATIQVEQLSGHQTPFSRAVLSERLCICGLTREEASLITVQVLRTLSEEGIQRLTTEALGLLTHRFVEKGVGKEAAQRYLLWEEFFRCDRPLLLLMGGTTGCGKSTITTDVAHRLEIVRTQSSDMLREVMRMMVPQRLLPVLHVSSYTAWETLPRERRSADDDELLIDGYQSQAEVLSVACEAVVQRALTERVSLILEGVHMHPSLMERLPSSDDALVVPVMLGVLKPSLLRQRLIGRGLVTPNRRVRRYQKNFERIWQLQSYLLAEADRWRVPIISNEDREHAVQQILGVICDELAKTSEATVTSVFGDDTADLLGPTRA